MLAPQTFRRALEKSHEAKAKVEVVANELTSANDVVKAKIAEGVTSLPVHEALADSEGVEVKVQDVAGDLHEVTDTLAQGIEDLKGVESALKRSRKALIESEAALALSQRGEQKAKFDGMHDSRTGLPNRTLFDDRLAQAISLAERHGWTLAIMFLDLDRFKTINDTHGHAAGDRVLEEIARRLNGHCRDEDTVCRNGGDEFLYLLMNPQGRENIERVASMVLANLGTPINMDDLQLIITPSIGIALYPEHGETAEQLVQRADVAMYQAKRAASGFAIFDDASRG
ncbi:GGDEF domain-containing protein [Methyloversatilis sp.]|uniref:GGDEF domain-containing protein n=1 Tax=Methyloversatilis sp. TaxID=2569862 RepID=UPI0027329772|nr:GGDEF domain-containing protein [Methyloversatilis sp.]MDP2870853.1 GGDEF domain-containing protein [Methyloversatilis sp.]MDP3288432.1 GGDEF domain-containing protein [Methyloversatilis sp.]MDP3455452.1 GGDEF domain-containing protein [Methyloversatilis sp.]MDP3577659.1 GGDEF domain-containing protein [Methyloversatilis sp.]